jgi:DNA processing protein
MNSIYTRIISQHIINQMDGRWRLPHESINLNEASSPADSADRYLKEIAQLDQRYQKIDPVAYSRSFLEMTSPLMAESFHTISCTDPNYPRLLKHIPRFPLALNIEGSSNCFRKECIAIIGARKATREALQASYSLGYRLARRGFCIVSGGALGCDAAAHQGAIDSGVFESTAVIFAGGLKHKYPTRNSDIFQNILSMKGALVSERLSWFRPMKSDFPIRNRIIAGSCNEVHVMQAGDRSGALITANLALDYGRDVRVWNPCLDDIRYHGSSRLMQYGAQSSQTTDKLIDWQELC